MSTPVTKSKRVLATLFMASILMLGVAACGSDQSLEIGPEPSIGTPQTLYRDSPVVTAELDVLGTVQVRDGDILSDGAEQAVAPLEDSSGLPLIWFAVVGLGLAAIVTTGVAAARGH